MTTAVSRPLLPVLARMALGLTLTLVGVGVSWQGVRLSPTPGLETTTTPLAVPLDGPLPLDLADAATLRFEGDRANINLAPLPYGSPNLLGGQATHRTRNPVDLAVSRTGSTVEVTAKLYVKALDDRGVVVNSPEPVQHQLDLGLTPAIPLTISTYTVGGNQTLDLRTLRIRAFTARSGSGDQTLTLPGRPGGPYAIVTRSGNVIISAQAGAAPEAVRVNSQSGDLTLNLRQVNLEVLNAGTQSGDVQLSLPQQVSRGSITTQSGNVDIRVAPGTRGNLDIRTQSGDVSLWVPPHLKIRIRFADRETIMLPSGTPPATAPQLDVFVDATNGNFELHGE